MWIRGHKIPSSSVSLRELQCSGPIFSGDSARDWHVMMVVPERKPWFRDAFRYLSLSPQILSNLPILDLAQISLDGSAKANWGNLQSNGSSPREAVFRSRNCLGNARTEETVLPTDTYLHEFHSKRSYFSLFNSFKQSVAKPLFLVKSKETDLSCNYITAINY